MFSGRRSAEGESARFLGARVSIAVPLWDVGDIVYLVIPDFGLPIKLILVSSTFPRFEHVVVVEEEK